MHRQSSVLETDTKQPSAAVAEYLAELAQVTAGDIRTDRYSRVLYSTDASIYQVLPHAVVLPRSVEELHATVELAAKHRAPILPRTGGSSLAGQAVGEAVVLDLTRYLDQVLEINREEHWVRVQPGVVLDVLNHQLRPYGLQFGPDPASSNRAAIGGIVANNSTGSHSIVYGMTADHALETGLFLSDGSRARFGPLEKDSLDQQTKLPGREGEIYQKIAALTSSAEKQEIIRSGTPKHWRRCGGYNLDRLITGGISYCGEPDPRFNLAKLICGSEGTLGVMHEIKLNLVPVPRQTALAIVHFDDIRSALSAVPAILETGPSASELLDHLGLSLCRQFPRYSRMLETFVEGTPSCVLITEFSGEGDSELRHKIDRLREHLQAQGVPVTAVTEALTPEQQSTVWEVRKAGLGLLMSIRGDYKPIPFIEDSAVPIEHLADYVLEVEKFCNDLGSQVGYYAHASAGCVHIRPLINTKAATEIEKLPKISEFVVGLLHGYGGSWSSEHGDGRSRSWLNERFFGPDLYGLYREVKRAFDPHNLLNPGNIVDAPAMTENLRYGIDYQVAPLEEHLDFSADQGFSRAVEMCNGAGICRKTTAGTMCPSYMVTQEEEHSTRGRANLLRAALCGELPASELTSQRMYEAMDLCIECKACKNECPSSVDMAKIKFEFLAHYYDKHGVPLRARLMAGIARWSRWNSGLVAPWVNGLLGNSLVRLLMEKTLGVSRHRQLPRFAREPFTTWFRKRSRRRSTGKKVVLFNDTFNTYNYPQVSIAVTELLEAAGYEVLLPGHWCCGRPMISKGLVEKARAAARDCVEKLAPFAEQGIPIVGIEPSCLLTLRDELLTLLPNEPRAKIIAENAFLFEEFFAQLAEQEELGIEFPDTQGKILLHGHCQQKALVGTAPSKTTLSMTGLEIEEVDSGCCGMAGSFGYEAEHYAISQAMGERRLLPAVRDAADDTQIVAAGVSCRQQIEHATGRTARHPAEVLHALYFSRR
ncbi:MAG: FAD-binding protein [Pirellulales bacterium]|nr:FAD-binding protein [Pirellulales bacterium]